MIDTGQCNWHDSIYLLSTGGQNKTSSIMGRGISKQKMLSSDEYDFLLKNTEFSSDQILEWYDEFLVS